MTEAELTALNYLAIAVMNAHDEWRDVFDVLKQYQKHVSLASYSADFNAAVAAMKLQLQFMSDDIHACAKVLLLASRHEPTKDAGRALSFALEM